MYFVQFNILLYSLKNFILKFLNFIIFYFSFLSFVRSFRSAITIFPQRKDDHKNDFRVWNIQLISYAGYANPETGQITGDPFNVEFTQVSITYVKTDILAHVFLNTINLNVNSIAFK